jgi:hypothetical protein
MRRGLTSLAVIGLGLLAGLGIVEAGFRILGVFPPISGPPRYLSQADENLVYSLSPSGEWRHSSQEFDYVIRTNQFGYRGQDWDLGAPAIAILGSSETFGFGTDLDSTFPARVQSMMDDAGLDFEVRNMGIYGHNLLQIKEAYRPWQERSDIRATVVQFNWLAVKISKMPSVFEVVDGYLVEVGRFPDGELSPPTTFNPSSRRPVTSPKSNPSLAALPSPRS